MGANGQENEVAIPEWLSSDLVFVTDLHGQLAYVSQSWERRLGYAPAEVLGRDSLDLVCPASQAAYREALRMAGAGPCVENLVLRVRAKGGDDVDLLATFTPRRDAQGRVVQIVGAGRDITELTRAQADRSSAQERLQTVFDHVPEACYLTDLMGTFLDANKAAEGLFGYQRQELVGQSFLKSDLLPRKQLPRVAGYFAKSAMGLPVGPVELRLNRKDGTQVRVETRTCPVQIGGQHVVLGTARDVSDHKRAEESLRESEEKFKVIFEEACEGIVYLDDAGRVLEVNRKTLDILGQSKEQVLGKHFIELGILDPGDTARFLNHFQQVLLGTLEPLDLSITNHQGRKLYLECSTSLVRRKGGPHGLVVMIRDVTERRQAETMLEALNGDLKSTVADLERSNQELRDFAHAAAHDLKTPLRGIVTLADWIAEDSADKIGEQGQANLGLLRKRADRMVRLIEGILRYAEVGQGEQFVEKVDTNAVVAEVVEQIAAPPQFQIRVDHPLPVVPCDRVRLTQVFQNLLGNAIKYLDKPEGRIQVGCVEDGDFWKFSVADNGPGIEAKYFERIFRIFQTLGPKDEYENTGIGLALVKKIVEREGGRVWIESEVGRGSTFFFTVPKAAEKVAQEPLQTCAVG